MLIKEQKSGSFFPSHVITWCKCSNQPCLTRQQTAQIIKQNIQGRNLSPLFRKMARLLHDKTKLFHLSARFIQHRSRHQTKLRQASAPISVRTGLPFHAVKNRLTTKPGLDKTGLCHKKQRPQEERASSSSLFMLADKLQYQGIGSQRHIAVVISVEFIKRDIGMPHQFQQSVKVCGLFIAPVKLQFAVAGKYQDGRAIFPDMIKRGRTVDQRLQRRHSHLSARLEMGYHLPAARYQACNPVGIFAVFAQQTFIQPHHVYQISSRRMAGQINLVRASPVTGYVFHSPCHSGRGIVQYF